MKKDTDLAWNRWGLQDPYFAVLSEPQYRKANLENSKQSFFESGQCHIDGVLSQIEKHFGSYSKGTALDFGCGVGRLLIPLSKKFGHVTGIDISKSMLQEASKNLVEKQIENVTLLDSDDALSALGNKKFDFIHTFIVLQHITPARGYLIVRNLLHHLSEDGSFFIHVSCRRKLTWAAELFYLSRTKVPGAFILFNILQGKKIFEPVMEGNNYNIARLYEIFYEAGFQGLMTNLEIRNGSLTASFASKKCS